MPVTGAGFGLYLLAFYFTVVTMMNLLIAIITERYYVLEQTVPMECIERCVLMNEIEGFVNFFKKFKKEDENI